MLTARVCKAPRPRLASVLLPVVVVSCLTVPTLAAAAACLQANRDGQVAAGMLSVKRAKDAAGRPERPYILPLQAPACLAGDGEFDRVDSTTTVQIYSSNAKVLASIRALVGKSIRVVGNPFGAHTAHHHAPIVMDIATIEAK